MQSNFASFQNHRDNGRPWRGVTVGKNCASFAQFQRVELPNDTGVVNQLVRSDDSRLYTEVKFWRNNAKSGDDWLEVEERKRDRADWRHLRYRCVTTTTRKDFNMHRLTDVPQRANFKCKYKSAMQTAEAGYEQRGWRRVSKGGANVPADQRVYSGGRTVSHASRVSVYVYEFSWRRGTQ